MPGLAGPLGRAITLNAGWSFQSVYGSLSAIGNLDEATSTEVNAAARAGQVAGAPHCTSRPTYRASVRIVPITRSSTVGVKGAGVS